MNHKISRPVQALQLLDKQTFHYDGYSAMASVAANVGAMVRDIDVAFAPRGSSSVAQRLKGFEYLVKDGFDLVAHATVGAVLNNTIGGIIRAANKDR